MRIEQFNRRFNCFLHCGMRKLLLRRNAQLFINSCCKIKRPAVKKGIRCKNHLTARRCNGSLLAYRPFNFFRRSGQVRANGAKVLSV